MGNLGLNLDLNTKNLDLCFGGAIGRGSDRRGPIAIDMRVAMINGIVQKVKKFLDSEDGPTAVEYAVVIMLIILVCITAVQLFGGFTADSFQNSSDAINAHTNGNTGS